MTNPLLFQGMPKSNTPLVNPDGTMNLAWYRFFQSLYTKTGLATPGCNVQTMQNQEVPDGGWNGSNALVAIRKDDTHVYEALFYYQANGNFVGSITLNNSP